MKNCPACGKELSDEMAACDSCGHKVDSGLAKAPEDFVTLPSIPVKLLARKPPLLSGICPTKALLHMLGIAIILSLALGVLAHYGGEAINLLGKVWGISGEGELGEYIRPRLKDAAGIALYSGIGVVFILMVFRGVDAFKSGVVGVVFAFVVFLLAMVILLFPIVIGFVYVLAMGIGCALVVLRQGVRGHCRNSTIYSVAGILNGAVVYGVHVLLVWLRKGIFHPLNMLAEIPWVIGIIEAVLIILVAAILSSSLVKRLLYCETHDAWYSRKWKQGRFPATQNIVNTIYWALDTESIGGIGELTPLTEEAYPFLVIRALTCPIGGCDVRLSATLFAQKSDSKNVEERVWFDVMVPGLFGDDLVRTLDLQEELPPLKK